MKAVIDDLPQSFLEERRRLGQDVWDEIWKGVVHMPAMPNRDHQALAGDLYQWLREHWSQRGERRVLLPRNIAPPGGWPDADYRIPDLILLKADRFDIDRITHLEGAPHVVIEIRSPGDESYEKLEFYAALGVPEVWVLNRDTRAPELFELTDGQYSLAKADREGWLTSSQTDVQLRAAARSQLGVRIRGLPRSERNLPDE